MSITPYLAAPTSALTKPHRLKTNAGKSFIGSYVLGMGFVLTPDEANELLTRDPRNKEVIYPYINGEDLNTSPDLSASRFVINFFDWPEERARQYPDCFRRVELLVKPQRLTNKVKERREKWWQFAGRCPALYRSIHGMPRVMAKALTSKHHAFGFLPNDMVYDQTCPVFPYDSYSAFALLQSSLHHEWSLAYGASLETRPRYTPTDCFETFPFPSSIDSLSDVGERYYVHRMRLMEATGEGLTKVYNRFHSANKNDEAIQELRNIAQELDLGVLASYGWQDIPPKHGFWETRFGQRFGLHDSCRMEVLRRLLELNHRINGESPSNGSSWKDSSATRPTTPPKRGLLPGFEDEA